MSGFEIAGIVLGALPLAISAFEGYEKVSDKWRLYREIGQEYQKSLDTLRFNRLRFLDIMEVLLKSLGIVDEEIKDLLSNPGKETWSKHPTSQALEARLHRSYPLWLDTMDSMRAAIEKATSELALDVEGFQTWINQDETKNGTHGTSTSKIKIFSKSHREYLRYRIRFSMGESDRDKLFKQLKTYNDRLHWMLSSTASDFAFQRPEDNARTGTTTSVLNYALCSFWSSAFHFYQTLRMAWNCNCLDQHYVYFRLHHRTSAMRSFQVVLVPSVAHENGKWASRQLRIEAKDESSISSLEPGGTRTTKVPQSTALVAQPDILEVPATGSGKGKGRAVSPLRVTPQTIPLMTLIQVPPKSSLAPDGYEEDARRVGSLCETMTEERNSNCAGYIQNEGFRYYLHPTSIGSRDYASSLVTLDDLLSGKGGQILALRQRCELALTLASSFLQLQGSPWIQMPWGKSKVYFQRAEGKSRPIALDQASVASGFPGRQATDDSDCISHVPEQRTDMIPGLDALAILLLELCFGRPIEKHQHRKKVLAECAESGKAYSDFVVAWVWLEEVANEAGADYDAAVRWCLSNYFSPRIDKEWRKEIVDNVLVPLERCCKCFR